MTPTCTTCSAALGSTAVDSSLDPHWRYCDADCRDDNEPDCHRVAECGNKASPDRSDGYCNDTCRDAAADEDAADRAFDEWADALLGEVA